MTAMTTNETIGILCLVIWIVGVGLGTMLYLIYEALNRIREEIAKK